MERGSALLRGSVRVRATAAATALVTVTLAVAAWLLLATLEESLERVRDDAARGRAGDLAALVESGAAPSTVKALGEDSFAQVVRGGRLVAVSTEAPSRPVATSAAAGAAVRRVALPDDDGTEVYRVWTVRADTADGPTVVAVGYSLEAVAETVSALRRLLLLGVPLVATVLGALTWTVLGRALRPVEAVRAEVAEISDSALDRRVPVPPGDDEIARLARTMNEMLSRLESSSARQRAFVADASHELQSPLTTFRTQLEVALAGPGAADWRATARELLQDTQAMERLVRDLLFLAREDAVGAVRRPDELVDLDDVVLEEAARLRAFARVPIDTARVSAAPVRGSREELARLVRNLLENADRHASSRVDVTLGAVDGEVRLRVADDGPGVPPEQGSRVFERFVRLDDARSRDSGGSGLGLSIVAAIARRHGGTVAVTDAGPGSAFEVQLPGAG